MKGDHILYFKNLVEELIVDGSGNNLFQGKFYEIAPTADSFPRIVPCAVLNDFPAVAKKIALYSSSKNLETEVVKTRQLYEYKFTYQVDFYSRNVYEHIRDVTSSDALEPFCDQLVNLVASNEVFFGQDGRDIRAECGAFGSADRDLIVDNIYMSFVKIVVTDGVYSDTAVPKIKKAQINDGGKI